MRQDDQVPLPPEQQRLRELERAVLYWKRRAGERMALGEAPNHLYKVLKTGAWRQAHANFEQYIDAPLQRGGLDATPWLIRRMVSDDPETLDLLDQALRRPHGGHRRKRDVRKRDIVILDDRPSGNAASQALRRLRKDRPDLHQRVLAGELTPHAAMRLAGFRKRTLSVPIDDLDALARTLCRHLDEPQRRALARQLTGHRASRSTAGPTT